MIYINTISFLVWLGVAMCGGIVIGLVVSTHFSLGSQYKLIQRLQLVSDVVRSVIRGYDRAYMGTDDDADQLRTEVDRAREVLSVAGLPARASQTGLTQRR